MVRRDVFGLIPERAGRLLDLGGGVGATSATLRHEGRAEHVTLVDRVAEEALPGIDAALSGNLEDPELIDRVIAEQGPFDTILCLDVLEHLYDPWAVVARLHKALSPGGVMIISVPNVNSIDVIGPLLLRGRWDLTDAGAMDRTHIRWFARHSVIELATGSGLKLEAVQPNIYGRKRQLLTRLSGGLLTRFCATQYVVRVRNPA